MPREINAAGYRLIKEFEAGPLGNSQPALKPYLCPAGRWTNGWGNTHGVTANTPSITRCPGRGRPGAQSRLGRGLRRALCNVAQRQRVRGHGVALLQHRARPWCWVPKLDRPAAAQPRRQSGRGRRLRHVAQDARSEHRQPSRFCRPAASTELGSQPVPDARARAHDGLSRRGADTNRGDLSPVAARADAAVRVAENRRFDNTVIAGGLAVAAGAATAAHQVNQLSTTVTASRRPCPAGMGC